MTITRDQRCRKALLHFITLPEHLGDNLHIEFSKKNSKGWKHAYYMIKIPKTWTITSPVYENRTLTWKQAEHIQTIPIEDKMNEIKAKFKEVFEPHEKKYIRFNGRENVVSYLRMYQLDCEENVNTIRFMVVYDKDWLPFPEPVIDPTIRIEKLERENTELKQSLSGFQYQTDRYFARLTRINNNLKAERDLAEATLDGCYASFQLNNAKHVGSYRDIINEFYKKTNKTFDCPVCYETIKSGDEFTTPCNHVVCNGCAKHCKNTCPMCRQEMCCILEDAPIERPAEA